MGYTMTTKEAASLLGVSMRYVQALVGSGRLRGRTFGRSVLLDPQSVAEFQPRPKGRPKKKPAPENASAASP